MIMSATLVSLFSCQYLINYGYMSKHVLMCCSVHHLRSRWCVVSSLDTSMTNIDCSKQTSRHGKSYIQYCTCIALPRMVAWLFCVSTSLCPTTRWRARGYLATAHSKAPCGQISNMCCVLFVECHWAPYGLLEFTLTLRMITYPFRIC